MMAVNGIIAPYLDKGGAVYNVKAFGAKGDGTTDDTTAIQAAIDAAGPSGRVLFPTTGSFYAISEPLEFHSGQFWQGSGGSQTVAGGQVELRATASMASMVRSKDTSANSNGFSMRAVKLNGNGNAGYGLNLTRHSYGRFEHCMFNSSTTANVLMDSGFSDRCYFNLFENCKFAGNIGVLIQQGANVNQFLGGAFIDCTTSIHIISASMGNVFTGVDMENASVRHVYVDAPTNKFVACHLESAPIGFEITVNGTNTMRIATDYTSGVTVPVSDASVSAIVHEALPGESVRWQLGLLRMISDWTTVSTMWDMDPQPFNGTAASMLRLFRHTNTTGTRRFVVHKGDGTSAEAFRVDAGTGDVTVTGGAWNNGHLVMGAYHLWVDGTGRLRIKNGAPTGATDGTVVGTQT